MENNGINAEWLDKLKANSDIVTIISRYLPLEKKGRTHWACCPFHHEKTPSFAVNSTGQFYKCFGCGESGDVIKFVEKLEGVDFIGACKILCGYAGIEMPEFKLDEEVAKKRKEKELYIKLCTESAKYYHSVLLSKDGEVARAYLDKRKVEKATITKMGLGYSSSWTGVGTYLKNLGYNYADMLKAGILNEKNGRYFDCMAERLVFPIFNHQGKVVGFSGRALKDGTFAKYKNTPQTDIFSKSSCIFGLNQLRKARLEDKNYAILVEGQMDVVTLNQNGFSTAIATMGTAFNKNHVLTLQRFVDYVVVCFDGDSAGKKATMKCLEPLLAEKLNIRILQLPEKLDPDEYIKKYGGESFQKLVDNAVTVDEFKIRSLTENLNLKDKADMSKFIDGALDIISNISKEYDRDIYLKLVQQISEINVDVLKRTLNQKRNRVITQESADINPQTTEKTESQQDIKLREAQDFILSSILHKKDWVKPINREIFVNNQAQDFYDYLIKNSPQISKLYTDFDVDNNEELKRYVQYDFDSGGAGQEQFEDSYKTLLSNYLLKKQEKLQEELKVCKPEDKPIVLKQIKKTIDDIHALKMEEK